MRTIGIIGGGASGSMAAIHAARLGAKVILFEKNEKIGKKIYITGKGRCNVTNASPMSSFMEHLYGQKEFLYAAFDAWSNEDTIQFFEALGVPLKMERGQRVFPLSDKSSDIIKALSKEMTRLQVDVRLHHEIRRIQKTPDGFYVESNAGSEAVHQLIIATGGLSYPSTGSTGDGYRFARQWQLQTMEPSPGLSGFILKHPHPELAGLTLKHVALSMHDDHKVVYREQGELLFTHEGISGPLVLTASNRWPAKGKYRCYIDFKPALTETLLDRRLIQEIDTNHGKETKTMMQSLLPKALVEPFLHYASIHPATKCHDLTREARHKLVQWLKAFPLQVEGPAAIDRAIITRGGIDTNELSSSTMESKKIKGLYVCGEVLNLHGDTGGYNLQIAFSTGYVAGVNAAYASFAEI